MKSKAFNIILVLYFLIIAIGIIIDTKLLLNISNLYQEINSLNKSIQMKNSMISDLEEDNMKLHILIDKGGNNI